MASPFSQPGKYYSKSNSGWFNSTQQSELKRPERKRWIFVSVLEEIFPDPHELGAAVKSDLWVGKPEREESVLRLNL